MPMRPSHGSASLIAKLLLRPKSPTRLLVEIRYTNADVAADNPVLLLLMRG